MKSNLYKSFYLLIAAVFLFVGCDKEYETIEEIDAREVQTYIQQNNLTGFQQFHNTGVYYQILTQGTGPDLLYTDKVFATLTVKSLDGKFSLTTDSLNRFSSFLGYFPPEAFAAILKEKVKRGGSVRIIIPSHKAYGRNGNDALNIPGNTSLDYTIKVYDVNNVIEFEDVFVKRYINENNIQGMVRLPSGLYYKIITPGAGESPVEGSTVKVSYSGKFTNNTVFDKSDGVDVTLSRTGIIVGWVEGLPLIKEGGKIRLIIPPRLGYGAERDRDIPPYSTLDFEIQLIDVVN